MVEKRPDEREPNRDEEERPRRPACPLCGGHLIEIRGKMVCSQCHTICETCCEGGSSG